MAAHAVWLAVLATNATCASNAYPKAIAKAVPNAPAVAQQGSSTLAAAIEGDTSVDGSVAEIVDLEVKRLLNRRMEITTNPPIDTLVLVFDPARFTAEDLWRAREQATTQSPPACFRRGAWEWTRRASAAGRCVKLR